jgi:hypothetical protein
MKTMYIDKEQDNQLHSIRQEIDTLKAKGDASFCKKIWSHNARFRSWECKAA